MLEETKSRVRQVIEERIRPGLVLDGGDIELVEVTDDGVVRVRLKGACSGCPFSAMTLTMGVEQQLKAAVPEVVRVEPVSGD
ncbi:MAG: NifU family protein [candidate division WOR-3 bacterium]